jgi:hypothetical protein
MAHKPATFGFDSDDGSKMAAHREKLMPRIGQRVEKLMAISLHRGLD